MLFGVTVLPTYRNTRWKKSTYFQNTVQPNKTTLLFLRINSSVNLSDLHNLHNTVEAA